MGNFSGNPQCPSSHPIRTQVDNNLVCYTLTAFCASVNPTWYDSARGLYCPGVTTTTTTTTTVAPTTTTTTATPEKTTPTNPNVTVSPVSTTTAVQLQDSTATTVSPVSTTTAVQLQDSTATTVSPVSTTTAVQLQDSTATTVAPIDPGSSEVIIGGAPISVKTVVDSQSGTATVIAGEVSASITGDQSSKASDGETNASLAFEAGAQVTLTATGFQSESEVEVVIYSQPRNLGRLNVDADGNLIAQVILPNDLEGGNHTLVLSGIDAQKRPMQVKFGLIVYGNESFIPGWLWLTLAGLVVLLCFSLGLNLKLRNRPKGERWVRP